MALLSFFLENSPLYFLQFHYQQAMGKTGPRYNERARASSHLTTTARPHPNARDGGLKSAPIKKHVNVQPTQLGPEGEESLEYNG